MRKINYFYDHFQWQFVNVYRRVISCRFHLGDSGHSTNQVAVPTGATAGQQINFTMPNGRALSHWNIHETSWDMKPCKMRNEEQFITILCTYICIYIYIYVLDRYIHIFVEMETVWFVRRKFSSGPWCWLDPEHPRSACDHFPAGRTCAESVGLEELEADSVHLAHLAVVQISLVGCNWVHTGIVG